MLPAGRPDVAARVAGPVHQMTSRKSTRALVLALVGAARRWSERRERRAGRLEDQSSRLRLRGRRRPVQLCAARHRPGALLGRGSDGALGYGNTNDIGDNETPASVGPVDLGAGRTARAIAAGFDHTCALLDQGQVRCWGAGSNGQLGYGNTGHVGDDRDRRPRSGPVDLGAGPNRGGDHGGGYHTCAILDTGRVRCWGMGALASSATATRGTSATTRRRARSGPVDLGSGRRRWRSRAADSTPARSSTTARCAAGARAARANSATATRRTSATTRRRPRSSP